MIRIMLTIIQEPSIFLMFALLRVRVSRASHGSGLALVLEMGLGAG